MLPLLEKIDITGWLKRIKPKIKIATISCLILIDERILENCLYMGDVK